MKREVKRSKNLQAFIIGIGELEILIGRLLVLFEIPEKVYISIDVTLPTEKLDFKNIDEMKQYAQLRGRITEFSLHLSQNERRVFIRSGRAGLFHYPAEVDAKAETEAWCAGVVETVCSFLQTYRVWYYWFVSAPIGWMLWMATFLPSFGFLFFQKGKIVDMPIVTAWLVTMATLVTLYFAKGWLLPSAILRITEDENFIRRHAAELSLLVALISVILTIAGWFIGKPT